MSMAHFPYDQAVEEVVAEVRELPAEEQDRVAQALFTLLRELQGDTWQVA